MRAGSRRGDRRHPARRGDAVADPSRADLGSPSVRRVLGGAALGAIVVAALYGPLVRAAARVPGLEHQVARLQSDNDKVRQLSAALDSVEAQYAQVRQMIGGDILRDPLIGASLPVSPPVQARLGCRNPGRYGLTLPRRWPLDEPGYITRGQSAARTRRRRCIRASMSPSGPAA